MKYFAALILFLALVAETKADNSSADSITHVFTRNAGKNNLYVLQLKAGGTYDHCRYTDKKTYHDYGTYSMRHGKIVFVSNNNKRGFSSVGNKTLFINGNGIYPTRIKAILHKKPVAETDLSNEHRHDWAANPFTNKDAKGFAVAAATPAADAPVNFGYDANFNATEFVKSYFRSLTVQYAPAYTLLIDNSYCGPGCYFAVVNGQVMPWSGDTTTKDLFNDFETTIHETTHHCNGWDKCMIRPDLIITIPQTDLYKSCEFKAIVPADASKKIFRYNTYVSDDSRVGANVQGIFGLMDEFSAYQNGCTAAAQAAQTAYDMGDKVRAKQFLSQAEGTYFAYYEFSLFIAWYLEYAEQHYPEMHSGFMNNMNLRVAFTLNEAAFQTTIANLVVLNAKLDETVNSDFTADSWYAKYPAAELVKHESTLEKFRVAGVTTKNYSSFLDKK